MFTINFSVFRREARMRFLAQEMLVVFVEPAKETRRSQNDLENINFAMQKGYDEAREGVMLQAASLGLEDEPWIQRHLEATIEAMVRAVEERRPYLKERATRFLDNAFAECRADATKKFCLDCSFDDSCCGIVLPGSPKKAAQPTCTQSLFALTQAAVTFTEELYKKYLPDIKFDVTLDVRFDASTPPLSGETVFVASTESSLSTIRGALVSISLPIFEINSYTYFSIAYVLAHEIAVHVVQEWLQEGQPSSPKSWVAFAEGLVDHVIWQELILATRKRKFFHSNALSFRAIPQIRRFHSERDKVADETGGVICWSADVALGRSAYETLLMIGQYVAGRGLSPTKPKTADGKFWVHETVLALNIISLSEIERQDVVELLVVVGDQYILDDAFDWPNLEREHWQGDLLARTAECLIDVRETLAPDAIKSLVDLAKSECGVRV